MKTLRAFWHWVDNDKPLGITRDKLSKVALQALLIAESNVAARAFGEGRGFASWIDIWQLCSSGDGTDPNARPEFFRPELVAAVRDLSLAICPALEAMHEAVGEAPPPPPMDFRKEYLGEWLPRASLDTFYGVDRPREVKPLSGVRVPQSFPRQLGDKLTARVKVREDARGCIDQLKDIARDPRIDCFHCDQSFPESQIDAHGAECRRRTLEKFQAMMMAPSPMLTPPRSVETQQALQQRNDYEQRELALQKVDATHPRVRAYNAMRELW